MMNKWKLATLAALIAAGIASPVIAHTHHAGNPALHRFADPRTDLRAFDMVPVGYGNSYSPALTGGGSIGYNSTNVLTGTAVSDYGLNGSSGLHAFGMAPRVHVRSGLRAYDMVPGAAFGSDSPSATGGGSIGYNSYVGRDS
jgi:hypothetical protein